MRALGVALGDTRVVWLVMATLHDPHRSVRHVESPHCPEWVDSVAGSPRVGVKGERRRSPSWPGCDEV